MSENNLIEFCSDTQDGPKAKVQISLYKILEMVELRSKYLYETKTNKEKLLSQQQRPNSFD